MNGAALVPWAVFAFAITNLDDLFLLTLFFAGKNRRSALRVIAGQYLGFTVLLLISVSMGVAGALVPERWIAVLGLVPLCLGVRDGLKLWRDRNSGPLKTIVALETSVLQVASLTIANGSDNLAVYIPAFAILGWKRSVIVSTVFYVMVGVFCILGWSLVRHQVFGEAVKRIGHVLMPVALILIGLLILRGVFT